MTARRTIALTAALAALTASACASSDDPTSHLHRRLLASEFVTAPSVASCVDRRCGRGGVAIAADGDVRDAPPTH